MGFVLIVGGLLCLWAGQLEKANKDYRRTMMLAAGFMVCGIFLVITQFVLHDDSLTVMLLYLCFGGLIAFLGICNMGHIITCNQPIRGIYRGYNRVSTGRGGPLYFPVFDYQVAGADFHEQSTEIVSKSKLKREFVEGEWYEIYVNEKRPRMFIVTKRIHLRDVLVTMAGLIFFGLGVWLATGLITARM